MKFTIFFSIFLLVSLHVKSQFSSTIAVESGENYASSGYYGNINGGVSYQFQDWQIATAAGITLSRAKENVLNALKFDVLRDFTIKEIPFKAEVFYQWRPYSGRLHEHDAGLLLHYNPKRFELQLGANTRIYKIPNSYASVNHYTEQTVWEIFNLMYKASYNQALSEQFNLKFTATNFDVFNIQQETNPMLIMSLGYALLKHAKLALDIGYLQAGLFNMRVNYFGYFTRLGFQYDF